VGAPARGRYRLRDGILTGQLVGDVTVGGGSVVATVGVGVLVVAVPVLVVSVGVAVAVGSSVDGVGSAVVSGADVVGVAVGSGAGAVVSTGTCVPVPVVVDTVAGRMFR
jgi:hypothetical protein